MQIRQQRADSVPLDVPGPYGVLVTLANGTEFRVRPTDDGTGLYVSLQDSPNGSTTMGLRPVSGNVAEVVAL